MKQKLRSVVAAFAVGILIVLGLPVQAQAAPGTGGFVALAPSRVLDTRTGNGAVGPVRANGSIDVQVT